MCACVFMCVYLRIGPTQ